MEFRISLTGDLGSGKSTIAEVLSKEFNAEIISGGHIQRVLASQMGLSIEQFNIFMEKDRSFDRKLDDMFVAYNKKKGNFIFDSRMSWHFVPTAVSFYLKVDPREAARRVYCANRGDEKYSSEEEALLRLLSRRASEAKRYLQYYGQDITDMSNYDFVIDTTDKSTLEVCEIIKKCVREATGEEAGSK